ncbi:MAG: hypothetical protein AB8I08_04555 [Sandaracinaceae bacterium]
MATILGLDIAPDMVRGVLIKTALRNSQVLRYVSAPVALPASAVPANAAPAGPVGSGAADAPLPGALPGLGATGWVPGEAPADPAVGIVVDDARAPSSADHEGSSATAAPDGTHDADAAVRDALRQVFAALPAPPDRVITELSGDEVSIRTVSLPAKAAKRLDDLLPFELEGKVPFEPEDSIIDHQPISLANGEMKLLAAVSPKDRVAAHLEQMKSLGVDPRQVAVGAVALDGLAPLLPALATPGPHCLIDIHAEGTDVCILQSEVCYFARTLSVSIRDLDAGRTKLLERELRQTMAAWRMEGGAPPGSYYLCGTMATRDGIDGWLGEVVSAPVEILNLPPAAGATDHDRAAYGRAAALAGRALIRGKRLNARQGEFANAQAANALRQHLPLMAACATVVLAAFVFATYARYSVVEARHQQLEDELAAVTEAYFGSEAREPAQAAVLLRRGAGGNDPMPTFDAYDTLAAISEAIPENVTHDVRQLQIDLGDGDENARFSLRGTVDSVSDTEVIVRALEGHRIVRTEGSSETRLRCFHDIEPGNITTTAGDRRSYRLEGSVHCEDENAPPEPEESSGRRGSRRRGGSR